MWSRLLTFLSLFALFVAAAVALVDRVLSLYIVAGVLAVGIGMLVVALMKRR